MKRGGVKTFGYPASRKFMFQGREVQFFQRRVIQIKPDGRPGQLNILDKGLLEYNLVNGATFPHYDEKLVASAPRVGSKNYQTALLDWIEQHVPNVWRGSRVNFLHVFLNTVKFYEAYPDGSGDPNWMPGINLEMWGAVTSRLAPDPNNHNFVYLRFQRGIMHFDKNSGETQGLLLGDHLKSIITGDNLPADLAEEAKGSALYRQYDNAKPNGVARPGQLSSTNLKDAFETEGDVSRSPPISGDSGTIHDRPQTDQDAIRRIQDLFVEEVSLTQVVSEFPWLADGLTPGERRATISLWNIGQLDAELARKIMDYAWLSDEITEVEQECIGDLWRIARKDLSLAQHLANSGWIADSVTKHERWALADVDRIASEDLDFARGLAATSLLGNQVSQLHFDALGSLANLRVGQPAQLAERSWYKDGITDEEAALIVTLRSVADSAEIFEGLIQDRHVRSGILELPSTGDIDLYVVHRAAHTGYDEVFEEMKSGIELIEQFMGIPWIKADVIVLLEPEWRLPGWSTATGMNTSTHVVIAEPGGTIEFRRVLYHDLAHFYWTQQASPQWFHEGSAQLLAYYTLHVTEQFRLDDRLDEAVSQGYIHCAPLGLNTIQEFLNTTAEQHTQENWQANLAFCPYILGESLLLGLYLELGHEPVAVSLRILYTMARFNGEPVSEREIYRTFLTHIPIEKEAEFQEIYQQYHGGPLPGQ